MIAWLPLFFLQHGKIAFGERFPQLKRFQSRHVGDMARFTIAFGFFVNDATTLSYRNSPTCVVSEPAVGMLRIFHIKLIQNLPHALFSGLGL